MLDLIGFGSGARRGRLIARGLVLLLVLSMTTLASPAQAAPTAGASTDCDQQMTELADGTQVVLPGPDPASCPTPAPVDCNTYLANQSGSDAEANNQHQVRKACIEYPGVLVTPCPGGSDLPPRLTLPNATVVHGDFVHLDIVLDVLFNEYDLQQLLDDYTDPADPDFYSAAAGLGYAVVPLDAVTLQQIIDNLGADLQVSSVHVYQGHKMSRGHPVDDFDDMGATGFRLPKINPGSAPVVVVDANGTPGEGGVRGHGAFANEVVRAEGVASNLVGFDVQVKTFFDDTDVVPALLHGFFGSDPSAPSDYPGNTVVNLSFGAHNCGVAPSWLTGALLRLVDNGHHLVASAGNNETNDLVFPAALAIDWTEYTASRIVTQDSMTIPMDAHLSITSVGSVSDSGERSCFSNYGVWVENWFPGEEVYAEDSSALRWGGTWSGTSFAAPQVAAAIANGNGRLPKQKAPDALMETFEHKISKTTTLFSYCAPGSGYEPR